MQGDQDEIHVLMGSEASDEDTRGVMALWYGDSVRRYMG